MVPAEKAGTDTLASLVPFPSLHYPLQVGEVVLGARGRGLQRSELHPKRMDSPDWQGSVGWASARKAKGHQFDSCSGPVPGLWMRSPFGIRTRDNRWAFLSRVSVSLTLSPSLPLSLKNE